MLVQLDPGISPPAMDARLTAYFHNAAGIFSFPTRITDRNNGAVRLAHSSQITRHQRRKYYRSKVRLPVFIKHSSTAADPQESLLLDLGGGGASLQTRGGLFKKGDLVEMSFSPAIGTSALAGRVLRVSRNGRVINVKFVSLLDAERNRIMGFLFKQSER
jgi:c-di-GMP-binding flagellar brake protein YcgR